MNVEVYLFVLGMQRNTEAFCKLILSFWVCARHAQSTQNKFAYLCNISRKAWGGGEVDFLPANEHDSFLQVDSITLGLRSQTCPKYSNNMFTMSL